MKQTKPVGNVLCTRTLYFLNSCTAPFPSASAVLRRYINRLIIIIIIIIIIISILTPLSLEFPFQRGRETHLYVCKGDDDDDGSLPEGGRGPQNVHSATGGGGLEILLLLLFLLPM